MGIYYHGTTKANKLKILFEGFKKLGKSSSHSFGDNIYFSESKENSSSWYESVIEVELDDSKLMTFENASEVRNYMYSVIEKSAYPNDEDAFSDYLRQKGYIGFKVRDGHGNWMIVVHDPNQIHIVK